MASAGWASGLPVLERTHGCECRVFGTLQNIVMDLRCSKVLVELNIQFITSLEQLVKLNDFIFALKCKLPNIIYCASGYQKGLDVT